MSMYILVFLALDKKISTNDLNAATVKHNIPVAYSENIKLVEHKGFLPSKLNSSDSGVTSFADKCSKYSEIVSNKAILSNPNCVAFELSWGSNFREGAVAFYTALALSEEYSAVAFDPQSNIVLDKNQLKLGAKTFANFPQ